MTVSCVLFLVVPARLQIYCNGLRNNAPLVGRIDNPSYGYFTNKFFAVLT